MLISTLLLLSKFRKTYLRPESILSTTASACALLAPTSAVFAHRPRHTEGNLGDARIVDGSNMVIIWYE